MNQFSTYRYYPFGMLLPGRHEQAADGYRYGYQGSESDKEIKGEGNSYTTNFRQLDPRIGRWLSIDPKASAWESPYASMGNNPILYNDPFGDTIRIDGTPGEGGQFDTYTKRGDKFFSNNGTEYVSGTDKYVDQCIKALGDIESSGNEGSRLINSIASNKKTVTIEFREDKQQHASGSINMDFDKITKLPTQNGTEVAPSWLIFTHELAHSEDYLNGTIDHTVWTSIDGKPVYNAEKYATHVENKIRADMQFSLRTHYATWEDGSPYEGTRIINNSGSSLFFKQTNTIIFKSNSEMNDGEHSNEVINSRQFNYNTDNEDNTRNIYIND